MPIKLKEPMPQISNALVEKYVHHVIYKAISDLTEEGKTPTTDIVLLVPPWLSTRLIGTMRNKDAVVSSPNFSSFQWLTTHGRATIITVDPWVGDEFSVLVVPLAECRRYNFKNVPFTKENLNG